VSVVLSPVGVCDEEADDAEPLFVGEEVWLLVLMAQRNETVVSESLVEDANGGLAASWKLVEEVEVEVEEGRKSTSKL
jgi:hypothetical protein